MVDFPRKRAGKLNCETGILLVRQPLDDRRGEVVALFVGELHRPQADFILSQVQNLNQERIQLPEARRAIADGLEAMAGKHAG